MNPIARSRRQGSRPTGYRGRLMLMAAALAALAGCESGYGARQGDPFVGIRAPAMPSPAAGTGTTPASTATAAVPPLPGSVTSPALGVVAGGTTLTPENPRADLRMPAPQVVPVSSPGAARGLAPSSAVLGEPEPASQASSSLRPVPSVPSGGFQQTGASVPGAAATSSVMTFEQAQQFLKKRGVAWQRLETLGDQGQWRFRCSIPVPNQKINHTYETVSPFPYDPLTAIRAVISQIEQGQH
ncbi:MAG TPA: hypothetical protein VN688_29100 [Gemmataceae bacterium]|nr:hypothetical protein [Gemmataceae bacterium]